MAISSDSVLANLLSQWEDSLRTGTPISPEELCRDHPELLSKLKTCIDQRQQFEPASDSEAALSPETEYTQDTLFSEMVGSARVDDLTGRHLRDYHLLRKLGEGGMGAVYLAQHLHLDQEVAIKVLATRLNDDSDAEDRFFREMRAAGAVVHPNVVGARDGGVHHGVPYLVMEYLPGTDLRNWVRDHGPLSPREAVETVLQAARGLAAAHAVGLVHRDIKPGNLLRCDDGTVKVLDLGLARFETFGDEDTTQDGDLTRTGTVMGTVDFMPPEQAADTKQADARSDLYSLGCVLYYLLTGQSAFTGTTVIQKIFAHRDDPIPSLSEARPEVSPELESVFQKLLAKDPGDRFQTANDLIKALDATPEAKTGQRDAQLGPTSGTDTASDLAATGGILSTLNGTVRKRLLIGLCVLTVTVCVLAGIFLRVETSVGTVVLEIDQPELAGATVTVDGTKTITLRSGNDREEITIAADEKNHSLRVTKGGFETFTKQFTLKAGGQETIRVRLEPKAAPNPIPLPTPEPGGTVTETESFPNWTVPRWKVAEGIETLPGVIADPAKLPGIKRWQVETHWPRDLKTEWLGIDWSPDGKLIAVGSRGGGLRLHDAETGELVQFLIGHTADTESFDWSDDGTRLVSGDKEGLVRIWSADGRMSPLLNQQFGDKKVRCLRWNPDGTLIASVIAEHTPGISIWNTKGELVATCAGHDPVTKEVAWAPSGKMLASCGYDGFIRIWDLAGNELKSLKTSEKELHCVAWSPDGTRLACEVNDDYKNRSVEIWDAKLTEKLGELGPTTNRRNELEWLSNDRIVAGGGDGVVIVFDADTGDRLASSNQGGHARQLTWSPSKERIMDNQGRFFDLTETKTKLQYRSTWAGTRGLWIGWDGDVLNTLTVSGPQFYGSLFLNLTGQKNWTFPKDRVENHPEWTLRTSGGVKSYGSSVIDVDPNQSFGPPVHWKAHRFAVHPGGEEVAFFTNGGPIEIWSSSGTLTHKIPRGDSDIVALCYSPDGSRLSFGDREGLVRTWNRNDFSITSHTGHTDRVQAVCWSGNSKILVSISRDKTVRLWKEDGTQVGSFEHSGWESEIVVNTDGSRLTTMAWDGGSIQTRSATGELLWKANLQKQPMQCLVQQPGGDRVAVLFRTQQAFVFDQITGELLETMVIDRHGNPLTFSPSGELLRGDRKMLEKELVYIVEREDDRVDLLKPSEFEALIRESSRPEFSLTDFGDAAPETTKPMED